MSAFGPVYPQQQTYPDPVGTSQTGQKQTCAHYTPQPYIRLPVWPLSPNFVCRARIFKASGYAKENGRPPAVL